MAEMYVATYDAVARVLSGAFGKSSSGRAPWYLAPEGRLIGATGAAAEAEADRFGVLFPGRVKVRAN